MTALSTRPRALSTPRTSGLPLLMAAEALAGLLGFLATVHLARTLGPLGFASLEFALSVSAWLLVLVRGGVEIIIYREAARHPRLIRPLTDHLLTLRLLAAALGYAAILLLSLLAHTPQESSLLLIAGLILWPSALACDVRPRALAQLHLPALAQSARASAYALSAWSLVSHSTNLAPASACLALSETVSMLILGAGHFRQFGSPRLRFRPRLWAVLLHRGALTTLLRFLRVGLYAVDVLVLGWLSDPSLGPYAASRRVVFALLAVGLVAPGALGPVLARAWSRNPSETAPLYHSARTRLLWLACPCAIGLTLTSGRLLNTLFGPTFESGAPLLMLLALRLPWLLLSSLDVSALVACRHERQALALIGSLSALSAVAVPVSAWAGGAFSVGVILLILEALGSIASFRLLHNLGVARSPASALKGPVLACSAMALVCLPTLSWPLPATCALGAFTYLAVWRIQTRPRAPDKDGASE